MDKDKLNDLDNLGEKLVKCDLNCESVSGGNNEDKTKGIIPRCINLEQRGDNDKGVIVVGINPARCEEGEEGEKGFYLKYGLTYSVHKEFMRKYILPKGKNYYHDETREILDLLDFKDNILWTEIVKCECAKGVRKPKICTVRKCVNRFLKEEARIFSEWTIFALGDYAYETCLLLFPDRKIIGTQHPSKGNPHYPKFISDVKANLPKIKQKINSLEDSGAIHIKELMKPEDY